MDRWGDPPKGVEELLAMQTPMAGYHPEAPFLRASACKPPEIEDGNLNMKPSEKFWTWKITMISSNSLSLCEHLEVYYCSVFDCICMCIIWMSRPLTFLTRMFWMTFKRVWENEVWNTRKCSLGCLEADGSILSKLYLTHIFLLRWYQHKFALKLEMFFSSPKSHHAIPGIRQRPMGQNPARGSRLPRALWLASSGRARAVVIEGHDEIMESWKSLFADFFAASSQAARYFDSKLFDIEIVVFFCMSQQLIHQHDMCFWVSLCHLVSTPSTLTPGWHKDVVKLTTLPIQGVCDKRGLFLATFSNETREWWKSCWRGCDVFQVRTLNNQGQAAQRLHGGIYQKQAVYRM